MEGGHSQPERAQTLLQQHVTVIRDKIVQSMHIDGGQYVEDLMQSLVYTALDEGLEQYGEYLVSGEGFWYETKSQRARRYESNKIAGRQATFSHFTLNADNPDAVDIWAVFDLESQRIMRHQGYYEDRIHRLYIRADSLMFMEVEVIEDVFTEDEDVATTIEPTERSKYLSAKAVLYDEYCSSKDYKNADQAVRAAKEFKLLHLIGVESGICQRYATLTTPNTRLYVPKEGKVDVPYKRIETPDDTQIGVMPITVDSVPNSLLQEAAGQADKTLCLVVDVDASVIKRSKRGLAASYIPLLAQNVELDFAW